MIQLPLEARLGSFLISFPLLVCFFLPVVRSSAWLFCPSRPHLPTRRPATIDGFFLNSRVWYKAADGIVFDFGARAQDQG